MAIKDNPQQLAPGTRQRNRAPTELEPVLSIGGNRSSGSNPPSSSHQTTHRFILNLNGERVEAVERITTKVDGGPAGIEVRNTDKVVRTPELWVDQELHWRLTHALRIMKLVSADYKGSLHDHWHRIYKGLEPVQVLVESGLNETSAKKVCDDLVKLDLLKRKTGLKSQYFWCVNIRFGAVDQQGRPVEQNRLIEGWGLPTVQASVKPQKKSSEERHLRLNNALKVFRSMVPENAEWHDGYSVFTTEGPVVAELAAALSVSRNVAYGLLQELAMLGHVTNTSLGTNRRRWSVRASEVSITSGQLKKARRQRSTERPAMAPATPDTPVAPTPPPEVPEPQQPQAAPGEVPEGDVAAVLVGMAARVAHYKGVYENAQSRIKELEASNSRTTELEAEVIRLQTELREVKNQQIPPDVMELVRRSLQP